MAKFGPKDIKIKRSYKCRYGWTVKGINGSEGDFDKAVGMVREKGLGVAAKKASKVAAEGVVSVKVSDDKAIIIGLISNDFVAQIKFSKLWLTRIYPITL